MIVFDVYWGRLGNGLFRYFASTLFCILYNAKRTYIKQKPNIIFKDENFLEWSNELKQIKELEKKDPELSKVHFEKFMQKMDKYKNLYFAFDGYFQHDIYRFYKQELIQWMYDHPDETVISDVENNNTLYKIGDILPSPEKIHYYPQIKKYDIVIHVRLEDFVITQRLGTNISKIIINPDSIIKIMDELNVDSYCIVSNKISHEIEQKYIDYISKGKNVIFENNDVITDFRIMNNAKILVCSLSTLSWCAGLLSNTIEKIYFPKNENINQSFIPLLENTILYEPNLVSGADLFETFS